MEDQRGSVRGPSRISDAGHHFFRCTPIRGDEIHLPRLSRHEPLESDPLAIWRPARLISNKRRKRELQPLASIHFAFPKALIWNTCISYPLPISGESRI